MIRNCIGIDGSALFSLLVEPPGCSSCGQKRCSKLEQLSWLNVIGLLS